MVFRMAMEEREIRRLARELLLLDDPFGNREGFKLELFGSEFKEFEDLVRTAYFDDCEFRLVARPRPVRFRISRRSSIALEVPGGRVQRRI